MRARAFSGRSSLAGEEGAFHRTDTRTGYPTKVISCKLSSPAGSVPIHIESQYNMKKNSFFYPSVLSGGSVAPFAATAAACLLLGVCPLASSALCVVLSSASGNHGGEKEPGSTSSPVVSSGWLATDESRADRITTWLLVVPSIVGLMWAIYEAWKVSQVRLDGPLVDDTKRLTDPLQMEVRRRTGPGSSGNLFRRTEEVWTTPKKDLCVASPVRAAYTRTPQKTRETSLARPRYLFHATCEDLPGDLMARHAWSYTS